MQLFVFYMCVFQQEDDAVKKSIDDLLRDHLVVLSSSKTSEDGQYHSHRVSCGCVESGIYHGYAYTL